MKKLSIEEKAKRYDEILKAAVVAHKDEDKHLKATLERIFPEFKESDDENEKIRKYLINRIISLYGESSSTPEGIKIKDITDWLEKQDEQTKIEALRIEYEKGKADAIAEMKSAEWSKEDKMIFSSIVDAILEDFSFTNDQINWLKSIKGRANAIAKMFNVRPKFHKGDTIVEKDFYECDRGTIKDIKDGQYIFTDGSYINIDEQDGWQLVKTSTNVEQRLADKIVEKARTEKQRILLTETDGSANIDWDCRSLADVKTLLKCGLEFIRTIESNKQILVNNRFSGCSFRIPTRYDKNIKQDEQKPNDKPKFHEGDIIKPKDGGHEPWQIMQVDILNKNYRFKDGYVVHFSQEDDYELVEEKPTDKPKFHEDDWIVYKESTYQIHNVSFKQFYECLRTDGTVHTFDFKYIDSKSHLWTIKDAKDGDVLAEDSCIFIVKYMGNNKGCARIHFALFDDNDFGIGGTLNFDESSTVPAAKEQRELLFAKMKEAGYEWNVEKKELKKIEFNQDDPVFSYNNLVTASPVLSNSSNTGKDELIKWSEEDENIISDAEVWLDTLCDYLKDSSSAYISNVRAVISKLKSLKDKIQLQPKQEWSGEDEEISNYLKGLTYSRKDTKLAQRAVDWLKSIKDRIQPKPKQDLSEEDKLRAEQAIMYLSKQLLFESEKDDYNFRQGQIKWLKCLKNRIQPLPKQE